MGWRSMIVRTPFRSGEWCSTWARGCWRAGQVEGERVLLVVAGLVEAGREDGLDGLVAQRADVERAAAGGLQALGAIGSQQPALSPRQLR